MVYHFPIVGIPLPIAQVFFSFFPQGFGRSRRETTLSSLRARRTPKTVVKCNNFSRCRSNLLVTSCSSDAQNCGEMQIHELPEATLSSFRAYRTPKTVVKRKFFRLPKQPSRHFVLVGRPCKTVVNSLCARATFSSFRARWMSKTVVKCKFLSWTGNRFAISCWSDVRSCGETMIFVCRGRLPTPCAHFIHFCARRCSETYILTFWMARRCSESHLLI